VKRLLLAMAAVLVLFGCKRAPEAVNSDSAPEAAIANAPATEPAPAAGAPFFVGRWAAEPRLCQAGAWVITERELHTAGEVSCRFTGPPRGTGPVEIEATCTAEGPPRSWRLRFAYAQSARALLVENGPFADVGLIRCLETPPVEPKAPGSPGALPDDRTPISEAPFTATSAQGAANVVQSYFALVEARRYDEAWRLWANGGQAGGPNAQAFAARFADYDSYHGLVGAPGRIEGAAGSLYVQVPVQVYGRRKDGQAFHQGGRAILRRSNDVPGSTAEQRVWRIAEIKLTPAG
jgi:hypothetical protein